MYDGCTRVYQSRSQRTSDKPDMTAANSSEDNEDVEKQTREKTLLPTELVGTRNLVLVCGRIIPRNSASLDAGKADYREKGP